MRECEFKDYTTDLKHLLIKLNRMYDVKAFSPRQQEKVLSIVKEKIERPKSSSTLN